MQSYKGVVQRKTGDVISGATVGVYNVGTTTLSTIYSDNGVTSQTNPMTSSVEGEYEFWAADGVYDIKYTYGDSTDQFEVILFDPIRAGSTSDIKIGPPSAPALFLDVSEYQLHTGKDLTTSTPIAQPGIIIEANATCGLQFLSGTTNTQEITFGDTDDNNIGWIRYQHISNTMDFMTNASVALTIDSSQNVVLSKSLNEAKGADIASATTTDIGAATGNFIDVTGTTTITGLGTAQAGTRRIVQFDGALTLTYNAISLILPGNANITTAAGDVAEFISLGSGKWICVNYQKDTNNPSLLYEIGTWTPAIQDLSFSNAEGQTYSTQIGNYTRIGNIVNITGKLTLTSLGTLTTTDPAFISGLPYTVGANADSGFVFGLAGLSVAGTYALTGIGLASNTVIDLFLWDINGGQTDLLISEVNSIGSFYFSGSYSV